MRAVAAAVLLLVVLLAALFGISRWENRTYAADGGSAGPASWKKPDITYNGVTYTPKQRTEAYLLMGVDVSGPVKSTPGAYNGGQADAQFLLVLDNEAETWQMLRLNRDSMVDVPVLDLRGDVIGYERQQLALAHAYGDGTNNSCQNTVDAVSMLLGGAAIDGYAALMDGIAIVNDAIGGVTVTITSDFTAVDPTLVEGETITLNGQQAFEYVRWAKVFNLKQMSKALLFLQENGIESLEQLNDRTSAIVQQTEGLKDSIRADEARLAEIAVLRGHILNYVKTREIYQGYKASGFSKVYFESHRQDLTLHKAAKEAFNERNLKKLPRIRDLNAEYAQLLERKKKNYAEYRQQKAQMQDWLMAQKIVSVMLDDKEQEQTEIHRQEERKAPEHS